MSKMGATPLYLAIILARANAYSRASVTLCVSGTVSAGVGDHPYFLIFITMIPIDCNFSKFS